MQSQDWKWRLWNSEQGGAQFGAIGLDKALTTPTVIGVRAGAGGGGGGATKAEEEDNLMMQRFYVQQA